MISEPPIRFHWVKTSHHDQFHWYIRKTEHFVSNYEEMEKGSTLYNVQCTVNS